MDELIDVRYAINRKYIKSSSPSTIFMAIEIHSLKKPQDSPQVANLSLALDCSSSMRGEKFNQAKESALRLFELLQEQDYLSVISFDKSAKVDHPSIKKSSASQSVEDVIKSLRLGKGTNIYEALELAYKEVSKEIEDSDSVTRRIVLLTDGEASVGRMEEKDFVLLSKRIREYHGITISPIGIGDEYDQRLLHAIAQAGGGLPYHVKESDDLRRIFTEQADEISGTVLISPTLSITMMPGAQIREIYSVTPTLRRLNVNGDNDNDSNGYTTKLRDIIVGQRQTLALRVDLPERSSGIYRLAAVKVGHNLVKNILIDVTDDHASSSKETDPYPRMILACSEATTLVNRGVQVGDQDTILKAKTLMTSLTEDKDFERVMTRRPIIKKMAATIRHVLERISQGPLSESDKREAIQDTTIILNKA